MKQDQQPYHHVWGPVAVKTCAGGSSSTSLIAELMQRRHSSVQVNTNSYLSLSSGLRPGSEPHGHRHSAPHPGIPPYSSKSANGFIDPKRHSTSANNSKPKCQICMRGSFTNYDPLITCSGCRKHYHDSCRKPSLAEGADA